MTELREDLQGALSEHYEILRELGGGGMSRVFLAREITLDREVVIKVLPPDLSGGSLLERFRREIGVAARLHHPNILGVLTAGEAAGLLYYTMPYVAGESLRARLEADARVSVEQAITWTSEIADALAHAHEHGIVHRDVKPENMLLLDGHAVLTDFGIAKAVESTRATGLTATGVSLGTPLYMAPEQAAGEHDVDARADIYALGCVLYELLASQPPFNGRTAQAIIAQHMTAPFPFVKHSRPDLPPAIDRVIQKATAKNAGDRWPTMREFATEVRRATQPVHAPLAASGKRRWWLAAAAVVLAAGAIALVRQRSAGALTSKDTILVGDFENTTGDSVFDGTLRQAMNVQLRQTPFLNVFPEDGIRETLSMMTKPDTARITPEIGGEICLRLGLKALVTGSIKRLGTSYLLDVRAVNPASRAELYSTQVTVASQDGVLAALQKAAVEMRKNLGESLPSTVRFNTPIEQATTSSLPALSAYAKGLEQIYRGNSREALPLFERAVELDTGFASAYNWMSWAYANLGDFRRTTEFAEKAYALRQRATDLERLHVTDAYHIWATGDWDKQFDTESQLRELYPKDWLAYNNLAIAYVGMGRFEEAATAARQGIERNPNEVHLYWHEAGALMRLGRFDQVRDTILAARKHGLDHPWYRLNLMIAAYGKGDTAAYRKAMDEVRALNGERDALYWEARVATAQGRWRDARELYDRSAAMSGPNRTFVNERTLRAALFGACDLSDPEMKRVFARDRLSGPRGFISFPVTRDGALCGNAHDAEEIARLQLERFPQSLIVLKYSVPALHAAVAMQRGQPEQALAVLEPLRPFDAGGFHMPNFIRGNAYLKLGKAGEAAREFQTITEHPTWDNISALYPLALLKLSRARRMMGDTAGSAAAEKQFRALWANADPDVLALVTKD